MAKHIQLDENDIPALIEFYIKKRDDIKGQLISVENILKQLQPTKQVEHAPQLPLSEINGYPRNSMWVDKLSYIISKMGKATASAIVDEVLIYEPDRKPKRKQLVPTISGILGSEANRPLGKFTRDINSRNEYEYQLNPDNKYA